MTADPEENRNPPRRIFRGIVSMVAVLVLWGYLTDKIQSREVILVLAVAVVAVLWMQFGVWLQIAHPDLLRRISARFGRRPITFLWATALPGLILMSTLPESIEDRFYVFTKSDMDDMAGIDDILQDDNSENADEDDAA